MEFTVKTGHPEKQRTNCLVIGVFETRKLGPTAAYLDTTSQGYLSTLLRKGDLEGKIGQTLLLHAIPHLPSERILLVGCGREGRLSPKEFREVIHKCMQALLQTGSLEAVISLSELVVEGREFAWKIRQIVEITEALLYNFDKFKSKKVKEKRPLRRLVLMVSTKQEARLAERAILEGKAIAESVSLAKDLGNTPPNVCTPSYLAKEAQALSNTFPRISTAVLDEKDIASLKMGALLSVGQGSKHPPRLITLEYRGRKDKQKPIVLVGKGITFDTGGNSLKPAPAMIGMKYDMCGAAAVLGALRAVAQLELPLNVVGVIPSAENMPGHTASRPDDIVTSMSGLTIEILNTDAEGRLILCDALTYCERFDPEVVIDVATLTGACSLTFSTHVSALLSNHAPLAADLFKAGIESHDRCWELPLWEEYQEALNSNFADIANIGNPPEGGTILGACFLSRFTQKYHWAHLDVANTAFRANGKERGATGRPVPLLVQYLLDRVLHA